MTQRLICPLGHSWNGALSTLCPECGRSGRADPEATALDAGTRVRGVPLTRAADMATGDAGPLPAVPGCEVLGEIARGGMGVVYRAHDPALGRDLALKVLRPEFAADADLRQRFVDEAQVTGQLQHPGIVPVYHIGTAADGRPCFTMKLVQGRTLGELLRERATPAEDLPRFLLVFEQVCQAMACAHDHGVLHRDLKPDNIMVGPFGEVLVMDWGLARVLEWARRGVRTVRTLAGASPAEAGGVLGTPAYMAPEQARGLTEQLDERADVFGLGAILCEILTGSPPYVGKSSWEVTVQAAEADLGPALARLETSTTEFGLLNLVRECLAVDRDGRPRDAGLVAMRVAAYRAGVMERANRARVPENPVLEVAPPTKAPSSGRRRLAEFTAFALCLGLALVLGFGWRRAVLSSREEQAARHDDQVRRQEARDRSTEEDLRRVAERRREGHLAEAWVALARAEGRCDGEKAPPALVEARAALEADERDREMVQRLDAVRLLAPGGGRDEPTDQGYRSAFAWYGLDVEGRPEVAVAQELRNRSLRGTLVNALDAWARAAPPERAAHLRAVASLADADPWRRQVRAVDPQSGKFELLRLAEQPEATTPAGALLLADALDGAGETARALALLRSAQQGHPGDASLARLLAARLLAGGPAHATEVVRLRTLVVGLSPDSASLRLELADAFVLAGQRDEGIAAYRAALRLERNNLRALWDLSASLLEEGRCIEARDILRTLPEVPPETLREVERLADLEERLPAFRAGRIEPVDASQAADLGRLYRLKGQPAAAVVFYARAFTLDPNQATRHRQEALSMAVRASRGGGPDALADPGERARWRAQARTWLRDEGTTCTALLASGKEEERAEALRRLRALLDNPDLAAVRNPDALAALPAEERKAWEGQWHDLGTLWHQAVTAPGTGL